MLVYQRVGIHFLKHVLVAAVSFQKVAGLSTMQQHVQAPSKSRWLNTDTFVMFFLELVGLLI